MKSIKDAMPFFNSAKSEKICNKHNEQLVIYKVKHKHGERVTEFCEMCEKEKITEETKELALKTEQLKLKRDTYEVLYKDSIIPDKTLLNASFENYEATDQEQLENKKICLEAVRRIKAGQAFNVILQGKRGSGKSHLAISILKSLNENGETSSLFVSVDEMLRLIKGSFRDKSSRYTEDYFTNLLSKVDYLVLDDLGAETGSITTDKEASNFVQRVLYGITNARQGKVTIVTTNLYIPALFQMYDEKLISRLYSYSKKITFENTKDRRISREPF